MRNLLALLAVTLLTVAGAGWYLDWFRIQANPADTGHSSYTVDVNKEKIFQDIHSAEEKIEKKLVEKAEARQTSPGASSAVRLDPPLPEAVTGTPVDNPRP